MGSRNTVLPVNANAGPQTGGSQSGNSGYNSGLSGTGTASSENKPNKKLITILASAIGGVAIIVILLVVIFAGKGSADIGSALSVTSLQSPMVMPTPDPTPTPTPMPTPAPTYEPLDNPQYTSTIYLTNEYVSLDYDEMIDVGIEVYNPPNEDYYVTYDIADESVVTASWGDWYDTDAVTLWLTCVATAKHKILPLHRKTRPSFTARPRCMCMVTSGLA
jgi:hypothetical protein